MAQVHSRPLFLRIAEATALILCPLLLAICFVLTAETLLRRELTGILVLGGTAGWAAADIVSGLVHWGFDRYGHESTPLLGPHFIKPFREHHRDPKAMTRHDFLETNGNTAMLGTVAGISFVATFWYFGRESMVITTIIYFLACTSIWSLPSNQVHKWAHQDTAPAPIRLLQKLRVILPPTRHEIHHRPPHLLHYCIAHGNLNRLLDLIRFFPGIEKGLSWFGIRPVEESPRGPHTDGRSAVQKAA